MSKSYKYSTVWPYTTAMSVFKGFTTLLMYKDEKNYKEDLHRVFIYLPENEHCFPLKRNQVVLLSFFITHLL